MEITKQTQAEWDRINAEALAHPGNSPENYARLSTEQQAALQAWIGRAIAPGTGRTRDGRISSYVLKHYFERSPGGFYITNGMFKGAMRAAGYDPRDRATLNWQFRIEPRCPRGIRERLRRQGHQYEADRVFPYLDRWEGL